MTTENGRRPWMRYLAVLLLGGWLGAAAFLLQYGGKMEELMLINQNLILQNDRLRGEVNSLQEARRAERQRQELLVEEIRIEVVEPKPDAFTLTEVTRRLERDLDVLRGKKVEQVGEVQGLLHEMLRRREYVVEGRMAEVRLKTAVIAKIVRLYVTIEIKNESIAIN